MEDEQACRRCYVVLPTPCPFFCPGCGAARVEDSQYLGGKLQKTTAHYDPLNRDYKPWREMPLMAPRHPPQLPPSITNAPKPSWKPPRRPQPLLPLATTVSAKAGAEQAVKKKKTKKKIKKPEGDIAAVMQQQQNAAAAGPGGRARTPGVVYFKQLAFQRRGGKRVVAPDRPPQGESPSKAPSPKKEEAGEVTLVHPLAVYEATWLNASGYTVHVSLIDRSHGGGTSRFFLRVGTVLEHPNGTSDDLQVLEVLPNDIARLLTPPLQYWIDLNVINVNEYYMSNFLFQSLRHIADRVYKPSRYLSRMIDQVLLVEAVYESGDSADVEEDEDGKRRELKGNLIAVATEQRVRRDQSGPHSDLSLDKTIAQRACRIPIGPVYDARFVMANVRMSVLYPDSETLLHEPLPQRHADITRRVPAKHVVLHVYPTYSERKIAPKVASFEPLSLPVLIGEIDVDEALEEGVQAVARLLMALCRLLHFHEAAGGKIKLGITGAAVLADEDTDRPGRGDGEGEREDRLRVRTPRDEMRGRGAGMEDEEGQEAEEGEEEDEEEEREEMGEGDNFEYEHSIVIRKETERDKAKRQRELEIEAHLDHLMRQSAATVRIQSLWRRALASVRVHHMRRRHKAAVSIQSLARFIIARYRVRRRQQQIAKGHLDRQVLQQADGWAISLVADSAACPAHRMQDCPCTSMSTELDGTVVQLYGILVDGAPLVVTAMAPPDTEDDEFRATTTVDREDLALIAASLCILRENAFADVAPSVCLEFMLQKELGRQEMLAAVAEGLSIHIERRCLTFDIEKLPLVVLHDDGEVGLEI